MRDIREILAEVDGLTDDQKSAIVVAVNANYRSVEEARQKTAKITELSARREALIAKESELTQCVAEAEVLREQVSSLAAAEAEYASRKQAVEAAAAFESAFEKAIAVRPYPFNTFNSQLARTATLDGVRELLAQDESLSIAQAIDAVTRNQNVWENPQRDVRRVPPPMNVDRETQERRDMARALFKDWSK